MRSSDMLEEQPKLQAPFYPCRRYQLSRRPPRGRRKDRSLWRRTGRLDSQRYRSPVEVRGNMVHQWHTAARRVALDGIYRGALPRQVLANTLSLASSGRTSLSEKAADRLSPERQQ